MGVRVCIAFFRLSYLHCRPGDGQWAMACCNVCPLVLPAAAPSPCFLGPEIMFLPKCIFIRHVSPGRVHVRPIHASMRASHIGQPLLCTRSNALLSNQSLGKLQVWVTHAPSTVHCALCCTLHVADAAALILIDAFPGPSLPRRNCPMPAAVRTVL